VIGDCEMNTQLQVSYTFLQHNQRGCQRSAANPDRKRALESRYPQNRLCGLAFWRLIQI